MTTKTRAAIVRDGATAFSVETVTLRDPGPRDVVVDIGAIEFIHGRLRADLQRAGVWRVHAR